MKKRMNSPFSMKTRRYLLTVTIQRKGMAGYQASNKA